MSEETKKLQLAIANTFVGVNNRSVQQHEITHEQLMAYIKERMPDPDSPTPEDGDRILQVFTAIAYVDAYFCGIHDAQKMMLAELEAQSSDDAKMCEDVNDRLSLQDKVTIRHNFDDSFVHATNFIGAMYEQTEENPALSGE